MKKERINFWDNFKGILIILVVVGHFLWQYYSVNGDIKNIVNFIYLFHMPLFIFVSGYLSRNYSSSKRKSIIRLIVYYLVFNTLMMLFLHFGYDKSVSFVNSYNSYWYLIALIIMKLTVDKIEDIKFIIPISIIIGLLSGFYSWGIVGIYKALALYPFFLVGYKLDKDKVTNFIKNKSLKKYILGIVIFILFLGGSYLLLKTHKYNSLVVTFSKYKTFSDMYLRMGIYIVAFISLLGFMFLIPNKKIPLVSKWGKNSLYIYVLHRFITLIVPLYLLKVSFNNKYYLYLAIASFITLLILGSDTLKKYLDKLFNKIFKAIDNNSGKFKIIVMIIFILLMMIVPGKGVIKEIDKRMDIRKTLNTKIEKVDEYIKLSYVGDLILLKLK